MAANTNFFESKYPVYMPKPPTLTHSREELTALVKDAHIVSTTSDDQTTKSNDETATLKADTTSAAEVQDGLDKLSVNFKTGDPFIKALHSHDKPEQRDMTNMMLTENADLAHKSTTEPLVDLFSELEEVVSGPQLRQLLESAWARDPLSTLKIIFNARSIHLGKSSRTSAYRCFGWLAKNHPATLLANLQWLSRPLIAKKPTKTNAEDADEDTVVVDFEKEDDDPSKFDVKHGVAHGYWKDLLNLLVLAVNGKLDILFNPRDFLFVAPKKGYKKSLEWNQTRARKLRHDTRDARHNIAVTAFKGDPFYRALHLTVAQLFANQLKIDLALLRGSDAKARRQISLCAKWAPSHKLFHDKHTFVVSTIAELMHPESNFLPTLERNEYLLRAREAYRKDCSALRKYLQVVERDLTAETFSNIKYDRVPSLAMNAYAEIFATKDQERFDKYITGVAEGIKKISGATIMPSKLIHAVREIINPWEFSAFGRESPKPGKKRNAKALVEAKMSDINVKVIDGQWNALVQRIKDSGKLENSIAVCDVSGSMNHPAFPDKTVPMDSSIGLSLLLAEVTTPPFGGSFITFSSKPQVQKVSGTTLREKIEGLVRADWDMNTDFEAVFLKCILPLARKHNVQQEDMVKQIFVFSDMQFDAASTKSGQLTTSFERIKDEYSKYGYEMPKLIFWNLAGGRAGTAPKPVTADVEGTALVSGYSQAMLKVFLDGGAFEDPEAEEQIVDKDDQDDTELVDVEVVKKQKMDPLTTVRKAISHSAYDMLTVVD